jgi:hypothetical protein
MTRTRVVVSVVPRVFRMGGTYRCRGSGLLVTAEDHEIVGGHRTGRVLVRAEDATSRVPVRWYCDPSDLKDMEEAPPREAQSSGVHA